MKRVDVLYRGPLASCNYDCSYCPFAKRRDTREALSRDREALVRFVDRLEGEPSLRFGVLFTPWGEALIRRWYRDAIVRLSWLDHVDRVAIQTNLSCSIEWVEAARRDRVALWATYHPGQTPHDPFIAKCVALDALGVRFSVGIVGKREHQSDAQRLRAELPPSTYLWVNAFKSAGPGYYDDVSFAAYRAIDPLFAINAVRHHSLGEDCATGDRAVSVDGDGNVRRCHFVPEVLGNLHEAPLGSMLRRRPCPNGTCGCHIGYVHLERLALREVFEDGLLERIPGKRKLAVV